MPTVGVIPPSSIDETHDGAMEDMNVEGCSPGRTGGKCWVKPPSGSFETAEDLAAHSIAGTPDEVVAEVQEFGKAGVEHPRVRPPVQLRPLVREIDLLGHDVLPRVR